MKRLKGLLFGIFITLLVVAAVWFDSGVEPKIAGESESLLPTRTVSAVVTNTPRDNTEPQPQQTAQNGTTAPAVKQTGKYTFEGELLCDSRAGTANEIYAALNSYRTAHGASALSWNDNLAAVASMRVGQVVANGGGSDSHAGFIAFTNDQSNFGKVGFSQLSENIGGGGGCPLTGVHIIELQFGRDAPHNNAQLDSWDAVGVAVSGNVTSVIFGRGAL